MIVPTLARMLVREHIYKPIAGRVLTLGRQTIAMTYEQYIELLKQENYFVPDQVLKDIKVKYDSQTRVGKGSNFITDEIFFNLLGIEQINVMDVSKYEGADILHNLNKPIPASLEEQFDFIIDGGTFDHLLDLCVAFENVVRMLRAGGRIFQWNAASNFVGGAYVSLSPDLFYDYYSLNKFNDCKVYIAAVDTFGQKELWDIYEFSGSDYEYFYSKRILMTVILAEKGSNSTYSKIPIQAQYRDDCLLQAYREAQRVISLSAREPYKGSRLGIRLRNSNINLLPQKSIFSRIVLKCKKEGLQWIFPRCLNDAKLLFGKHRKKEVKGFRYLGKI